MNSTSPQYITPNDGEKGVLRAPFIMQSFYCLNLSDKWVYVSPGSSGSTSVNNVLYSHVLPPFSEGILPSVGEYLAYLVSNDAAFNITATVGQDSGDARVVFIMYDYPFTMPVHALPGTTIAAELVSGDLSVNRLHALIAAAIGAGVVDDTIKLLITPNATTEMGLRIQGLASQSASLLEVLDSTSAVMFDVDAGGIVHIGSLSDNSVVLTGVSGRLQTDTDITFSGTRLTVTDLTVTNSPIVSALTQGRVLIAGSSKEITDDAGMSYNATTNKLTVSGGIIDSALTAGRVAIVGTSGEILDDAGLTYDATTNDLTVANDLTVTNVLHTLQVRSSILTPGRVVFVGASDDLTDDADMTFSGTRLTVTDLTVTNAPIVSSLTAGRVLYAGASKEIKDEAGFTYNDGTNTLTADAIVGSNSVSAGTVTGTIGIQASNLTSGRVVIATTSGLLTDDAGLLYDAATNALTVTGAIKSDSDTGGIGYATGAGGTVTQLTSKTTGVTNSKICGTVVTHNAALGAGANAVFLVTNTKVAAGDVVILNFQDTAASTANAYGAEVAQIVAGGFNIRLTNVTAGSLSEAVTINFAVIKAVSA